MRAATLGLAALSQTAFAIMIPSTVSVPELSTTDATNLKTFGSDPRGQLLKVECAGCMFAQKDAADRLTWTAGVENALVLNVSVGEQVGTIELNGVRFYPPLMNFAVENPVPYIPQIPAEMSLVDVRSNMEELAKDALRLTSWSFQAAPAETVSESGDELLTIHLQLDALEREPINVPDIAISALKNADGELSILKVEMKDKEEAVKEQCESWPMMCKLKEILSGFKGMKPHFGGFGSLGKPAGDCEGNKDGSKVTQVDENGDWIPGSGPPPWITGDKDYKGWKPGQGRPPPWAHHGDGKHHGPPSGHHGPPGGKHHGHSGWKPGQGPPPWVKNGWKHGQHGHHGFHRAMHIFGRVMLTVFVPILLGIAAGMVTYLLGMVVGAVATAIYMKIRGRRTKYQAVALVEEVEDFEVPGYDESPRSSFDEKDGLLEAPPVYVEKE